MRSLFLLAAALMLVTPSFALADESMSGMDMKNMSMPGTAKHSDKVVKNHGLTAVFHFNVPKAPLYTCPMHPHEVYKKPGKDSEGMTLQQQNVTIGMTLEDAARHKLTSARVHLVLKDAGGMSQDLNLLGKSYYQNSFYLPAGTYQVIAEVRPVGKGKPLTFTTAYQMK
jgi:hypothetical protein